MITYEDLLPNLKKATLTKNKKELEQHTRKLDLNNDDDKWLVVTYTYAKIHKLKSYKARSFASELTLFLTQKIYDTDVNLIYDEARLDSYLLKKFNEIKSIPAFIEYLLQFYKSSESWYYEHISKYLQFRLTEDEREMYNNIPMQKPKQKFIYLLENFDYNCTSVDFDRNGELTTNYSINLTPSEHSKFMSVCGSTKTDKFLNLLYFWKNNLPSD